MNSRWFHWHYQMSINKYKINKIHYIYTQQNSPRFKQAFPKHANKYTLAARGADTQLDPSCVSAPLAINMDLWNPICQEWPLRIPDLLVLPTYQ